MTPTSHVTFRIAELLSQRRQEIIGEWLRRLCEDPRIPSTDRISRPALIDHVPLLLDDIIRLLLTSGDDTLSHKSNEDAKDHGIQRLQQGYRLEEVLREFAQLRALLMEEIANALGTTEPLAVHGIHPSLGLVQGFLDDLASQSVRRYVEEQQFALKKLGDSRLDLMRTVSHELRNMLNSLGLAAHLLDDFQEEDGPRVQELLGRNILHMKGLLDDVLELSSLVAGKAPVRIVDLQPGALMEEIASTYAPLAEGKGLQISVRMDTLPPVRGDERKIKQIAANLVSNAIKYTDAGTVGIELQSGGDTQWSIVVSDTGVGIAEEEHDEIFSELYRAEKTAHIPGVGLGLAIVSRLVEMCGGGIRVESAPGKGSRFEVILPTNTGET